MYTALPYTPDKEPTRYLVDFEPESLAGRVRGRARACGVSQVQDPIAITDGGNGLEEAWRRPLVNVLQLNLALRAKMDAMALR